MSWFPLFRRAQTRPASWVSFAAERSLRATLGLLLLALGTTAAAADDAAEPVRILFLGDSLTAGYGLGPDQAYPALIAERLEAEGHEVEVINAGVSGETTAGGLRRVRWVLRRPADILVLALGANDGLRGTDPATTRQNLQQIIDAAREQAPDIRIVLAGMLVPPNMGEDYFEAFARIYPELAEENDIPLIPFLLEGVAGEVSLNQADGIHPTAEGQRIVAELVYPFVEQAVEDLRGEAPED